MEPRKSAADLRAGYEAKTGIKSDPHRFVPVRQTPVQLNARAFLLFGYQRSDVDDLDWLINSGDRVLVDIRRSARSQRPEWNGDVLQERFGRRYLHLPEWGNLNFGNDEPVQIANWDLGLATLAPYTQTLVLMCMCQDVRKCHRWEIKRRLELLPKPSGTEMYQPCELSFGDIACNFCVT